MRTTSPFGLHKSAKDTRNHVKWNPSEQALKNIEVDEAGKLAAFRGRFGRGWDAPVAAEAEKGEGANAAEADKKAKEDAYDPLGDLISSYASPAVESTKPKTFTKKEK
jgi:hypothetical protein